MSGCSSFNWNAISYLAQNNICAVQSVDRCLRIVEGFHFLKNLKRTFRISVRQAVDRLVRVDALALVRLVQMVEIPSLWFLLVLSTLFVICAVYEFE